MTAPIDPATLRAEVEALWTTLHELAQLLDALQPADNSARPLIRSAQGLARSAATRVAMLVYACARAA